MSHRNNSSQTAAESSSTQINVPSSSGTRSLDLQPKHAIISIVPPFFKLLECQEFKVVRFDHFRTGRERGLRAELGRSLRRALFTDIFEIFNSVYTLPESRTYIASSCPLCLIMGMHYAPIVTVAVNHSFFRLSYPHIFLAHQYSPSPCSEHK